MTLTQILQKIKSAFYTKAETDTALNAKANDSDVVHKSGNETIAGSKTFNNTIKLVGNNDLITNTSDNTYINIVGGTSSKTSAFLQLVGKEWNYAPNRGMFVLAANNGTSRYDLGGKPDGTLTWGGSNFTCTNGALGNSSNKWKTINGFDVTGIGHIGYRPIDQSGDVKTYTRNNTNVGNYTHYCVAPDNGWVTCREHNGSGTFQVCALGSDLNGDPNIISPKLDQFQFGSIPVRKGEYYAIISDNASAAYTMRFIYNNG